MVRSKLRWSARGNVMTVTLLPFISSRYGNILWVFYRNSQRLSWTTASLSNAFINTFFRHCAQDSFKCPKNIDSFKSSPAAVGKAPALAP